MENDRPDGPRKLTADLRAALISGVKRSAGGSVPKPSSGANLHGAAPSAAAFGDLPGFEAIRTKEELGRELGIRSPFYRLHEAKAGVETVLDGVTCTNFTSYDYLGLNGDPRIVDAVSQAAAQWGTSVSASRLTSGERPVHRELEGELSQLYRTEAALVFVSGHATNLAAIATLLGPQDLVVHDSLSHNSIVLGAQLSGASRLNFPHNDLAALDALLTRERRKYRNCMIVTEGLFSMDGDGPDLGALIEIKQRHGAWLMVDEAHSLGVLGKTGRGLFEHCGVDPEHVDIWMGTLSKTLVSCGGYIAGSNDLIRYLQFQAPGMVYSVGMPVPAATAALKALEIMLAEPERVRALQRNGRDFLDRARAANLDVGSSWGYAVTPIILGDSLQTVLLAEALLDEGYVTVPVFPPGVPERMARLRLFISAGHTEEQIAGAVAAIERCKARISRSGMSVSSVAKAAIKARLGLSSGKEHG